MEAIPMSTDIPTSVSRDPPLVVLMIFTDDSFSEMGKSQESRLILLFSSLVVLSPPLGSINLIPVVFVEEDENPDVFLVYV